jgi:protein-S-isoprenylcysteine O-methyltransferase Ste14
MNVPALRRCLRWIDGLRPRVARPASRAWNTLKTLLQIAAMWGVLLVAVPLAIHRMEARFDIPGPAWTGLRPGADVVGVALVVAGSLLGLWTANVMVREGAGTPLPLDTARELVVAGPYRHVRNPMAIGGFCQGIGVAVWLGSPAVLVYVAIGMAIWQWIARPWEERDLEERFGDRYRRYRLAVPCWLPRLTSYGDRPPVP